MPARARALTECVARDALPSVGIPQPDFVVQTAAGQQAGLARVEAHHPGCAAVARQGAHQAAGGAGSQLHSVVTTAGRGKGRRRTAA